MKMTERSMTTNQHSSTRPGTAPPTGRWFEHLRHGSSDGTRLVLFHHAGASASMFRPWLAKLDPSVDVVAFQLPGRDRRIKEGFKWQVAHVVHEAIAEIEPLLDRPLVFFGHSIGALIAFELVRAMRQRGWVLPRHLILSGRRAPHLAPPCRAIHEASDEELIAEMSVYGGIPPELLADRDVLALFLPRLRADCSISLTHRWTEEPRLPCPITALAGDADAEAPIDAVRQWREHTMGPFRFLRLKGGHFFITSAQAQAAVLGIVNEIVAPEGELGLEIAA
jgi:medium-chain acyl-[acyl-carrier-protein] hydrolase